MTFNRRQFLSRTAGAAALAPMPLLAQGTDDLDHESLRTHLDGLFLRNPQQILAHLEVLRQRGGMDLVSSLIFASRFSRVGLAVDEVLTEITGDNRRLWFNWMLWQEENPDVVSHPVYHEFKSGTFLRIDASWDRFLKPEYIAPDAMRIRFEEVAWGGVVRDGIPSLDDPELIEAAAADYLRDDDLVFGIEINGDIRAYPLRIMGWHEMFNEVIGGVPVALAYCTLCGAGILFETDHPDRDEPFVFSTSGFLYRSNKLMYDRQTDSLWNQFTGEPISGELANSGLVLAQRPVVITEWGRWKAENPGTKVLSLETGYDRDYGSGVVYRDYFASPDLMFPTLVDETKASQKDFIFGVRLAGGAKAWPLTAFEGARVLNDQVGFHNLVLIGDAATRTVRAYDRGDLEFTQDLTADGAQWTLGEAALTAPDGRQAPRVAGHVAFWFAWAGYLGDAAEFWRE